MYSLSGSITSGGVAQAAAGVRFGRTYLMIQNKSAATEAFWIAFGEVTATTDSPSIEVTPGSTFTFEGRFCPTDAISVIATSTGTKFTIWEG